MNLTRYQYTQIDANMWVITDLNHDYKKPSKAVTFAFDTETLVYLNGRIVSQKTIYNKTKKLKTEEKRKRLSNKVWSWQCYDEVNGFFMTNDFYIFLDYLCRCGYKFGWCYNATFDFAQIDYELLGENRRQQWQEHAKNEVDEDGKKKGYDRGQPWTYKSLHNDCGARYSYKLWIPYRDYTRHVHTHAVDLRDFMKFLGGGLANVLNDLDVRDENGDPIRKLKMDYQGVNTSDLNDDEIDYNKVDVKGLYFAIKQFNDVIETQSNNECHIFGKNTNIMTAGGFAKRELLRSMYPTVKPKFRLERYQKAHPIYATEDKYYRDGHLYRGGISFVNEKYRGRLVTKETIVNGLPLGPMYRYDVNSEYPYSMASIRDLVGRPQIIKYSRWLKYPQSLKDKYECIYKITSITGTVKENMLGMWYDPFRKSYVDEIDEIGLHLMFERELNEMCEWYDDIEYNCDEVILFERGDYAYKPFVDENYTLKAEAKKAKNKSLQANAKLKLNSSYGKLSERIEKASGHFELNEETGAIHYVADSVELQEKSIMNVVVGALVTSFARCYILSKIREICGDNVKEKFVYIDTDSVHAFAYYDKCDDYNLGGLKCEMICDAIKYIAPKAYIDIEKVNKDGTVDYDAFEIHSKGVSISAVNAELKKKRKGKKKGKPTLALIDNIIGYGSKFICLQAMNVKGGKVLVPTEKYLARPETAPNIVYNNMEIGFYNEL